MAFQYVKAPNPYGDLIHWSNKNMWAASGYKDFDPSNPTSYYGTIYNTDMSVGGRTSEEFMRGWRTAGEDFIRQKNVYETAQRDKLAAEVKATQERLDAQKAATEQAKIDAADLKAAQDAKAAEDARLAKIAADKAEAARIAKEAEDARLAKETADRIAAENAERLRVAEEQRLSEGRAARDVSLTNYQGALDIATTKVDEAIAQEKSRATLRGVSYDTTEEQRSSRISDQLSTVWSEGQQKQADRLFREFGTPDDFGGFITRGTAPKIKPVRKKPRLTSRARGAIKPVAPTILAPGETLGAGKTILGG